MSNIISKKGRLLLCLCLAVFMIVALSACGQSDSESAELPSSQTLADDPEDSQIIDEDPGTETSSPSLDEIMDAVLQYAESTISKMYSEGETDAYNIFEYLCSVEMCVPKSISGIIAIRHDQGATYTYNNTGTIKCTVFTVRLDTIDPETGEVTHLRTFSSKETRSCTASFSNSNPKKCFDSSLTRMTAYVNMEDGSEHVGWIDEDGKFTDVSAMVTDDTGDFGALTKHNSPCFGPGDYFYFMDSTNTNVAVKRVPLSDLTPSAVEVILDNVTWKGAVMNPLPDGSVVDSMFQWQYYDEEMLYPAVWSACHDWISPTECVGTLSTTSSRGMIYKFTLTGKTTGISDWYSDKTALVPNIKDRYNWDPVVSPDKSQVAFLSKLTTGTDQSGYLFIVPVNGGDPVQVPTEYTFTEGYNTIMAWFGSSDSASSALVSNPESSAVNSTSSVSEEDFEESSGYISSHEDSTEKSVPAEESNGNTSQASQENSIEQSSAPTEASNQIITDIKLTDFDTFKGKKKEQLISMFGEPDAEDATRTTFSMSFNDVSFSDYPGSVKFFFDGAGSINCASWTSDYSSKALYDELLAKFRSIGDDGEVNYPKDGQVEQTVHLTNGRDFVIGYEDSSDGNYTYFFTRY